MSSLNGAQVLVKCLENIGVERIFGHPGGAAINIFDALVDSSIDFVLTRHEQGAVHMADGYARTSGKPGVVLVTSGPGALNTVTGLVTAKMDSVPIIVITGQTNMVNLGKDAFQESDVFGVTMPVVKYSYLVLDPDEISGIVHEAHFIATTGRPGPVLIDLPKDISNAPARLELNVKPDLPGYQFREKPIPLTAVQKSLAEKMAGYFSESSKPLILVGHGALLSGAAEQVTQLAEKLQAPVTNTLLGKGGFPETHELALGMLGMHGNAWANHALDQCDLILSIGSRFDDRINGNNEKFCPEAIKLHIDIDQTEIDKIVQTDASICADAKVALEYLNTCVQPMSTKQWLEELNAVRVRHPLVAQRTSGISASGVIQKMYELTSGKAIVSTDVGQHQMWAAQFFLVDKPDTWLSSGGAGTMGFGMPAAIGAQMAVPDATVIAFVGDGGFQMTECELATAAIHKLPIKIVILDNKCLGMVRQWQELFYDERYSGIDLVGNPDFVKLADAFGIKAFHVKDAADIDSKLAEAISYRDGPCLIHAEIIKEDNVFPMIPAGKSAADIVLSAPTVKLEKPIGST